MRACEVLQGHVIEAHLTDLTVMGAHIPNASQHGAPSKVAALSYLLAQQADRIVLAGDFNCPKFELFDGTIVGWGGFSQRSIEETLFGSF